jgi:hypothetical protein
LICPCFETPSSLATGFHIERWLMTEGLEGEGMDRPDEIVVTRFADSGFDR